MGKKKGKKIRIEFRKNRENRARQNDLTREALDTGVQDVDYSTSQRVSGKGDLTRHRTIIGEGDGAEDVQRQVDESQCLKGVVLRAVGLTSLVETENGREYECTIRRVLRTMARDERNAVVAGDHVLILPTSEDQAVIERVEPRRGVLSRGSQRREHVIVANVDQVLIVVSADNPPLKPHLLDRYLISADKGGISPLLCINKVDLVPIESLQSIAGLYSQLGYHVLLTSAATGQGVSRLRRLMKGKQTAVSGQSGVGKSSLLNAVQPGLRLQTGEVSDWTRKGKHTTRRAELLKLDSGGWVVDTPGVRQFELWDVTPEEIEGLFLEFRPFVVYCKFPDCTHTHESQCGVKEAVSQDLISSLRYDSFLKLLDELQQIEEPF